MRVPRSRGIVSGLVIVVLGLWAGIVPFVGPYFDYSIGSAQAFHFTYDRLWLDILPAAVAVVGGLVLLGAADRAAVGLGGGLAILGGAWLIVGPSVSMLWEHGGAHGIGVPLGASPGLRAAEQLGYFYATGAVILGFGVFALGRTTVRSVRDAGARAARTAAPTEGFAPPPAPRVATRPGGGDRRRAAPPTEPVTRPTVRRPAAGSEPSTERRPEA